MHFWRGGAAALISGAPSTILALWRGEDPLEASLAAGSVLVPGEQRRSRVAARGSPRARKTLSLGGALLLTIVLPQRATIRWSTIAGLAIAGFDLGIVGRHVERIRAFRKLPHVADHLAYGLSAGAVIAARRNGDRCRSLWT